MSPLGYILGDEGSGAVLGKLLVGDVLKKQLPEALCDEFLRDYNLDRNTIIDRVYRKPAANRFLASFAPFLTKHIDCPEIHELVVNAFKAFFKRNVANYEHYDTLPCNFVGSIAHHFRASLQEAADLMGITIGQIVQDPMEGLIKYHTTRQ